MSSDAFGVRLRLRDDDRMSSFDDMFFHLCVMFVYLFYVDVINELLLAHVLCFFLDYFSNCDRW